MRTGCFGSAPATSTQSRSVVPTATGTSSLDPADAMSSPAGGFLRSRSRSWRAGSHRRTQHPGAERGGDRRSRLGRADRLPRRALPGTHDGRRGGHRPRNHQHPREAARTLRDLLGFRLRVRRCRWRRYFWFTPRHINVSVLRRRNLLLTAARAVARDQSCDVQTRSMTHLSPPRQVGDYANLTVGK